jgi:hypothetical protein
MAGTIKSNIRAGRQPAKPSAQNPRRLCRSSASGASPTPSDFVNPQDALVLGWNKYRIEVNNDVIKVALNGADTAQYTIPDPATVHFPLPWDQRRGHYGASEPTFIGLQSYSNYSYTTAFRNIRATAL